MKTFYQCHRLDKFPCPSKCSSRCLAKLTWVVQRHPKKNRRGSRQPPPLTFLQLGWRGSLWSVRSENTLGECSTLPMRAVHAFVALIQPLTPFLACGRSRRSLNLDSAVVQNVGHEGKVSKFLGQHCVRVAFANTSIILLRVKECLQSGHAAPPIKLPLFGPSNFSW